MNTSDSVTIHGTRRLFDGFFKLDELTVSHRRYDGATSPEQRFLVFERGDSVAAVIFNRDTGKLVLVEQFRPATLGKGGGDGRIIEAPAGMVGEGESPIDCVVREILEETGYRVTDPQHVATIFASPGSSSERIFIYCAVVGSADREGAGGGLCEEGEDIRIVEMTPHELFEAIGRGEIHDPKLIIGAYRLRESAKLLPAKPAAMEPTTRMFRLRQDEQLKIGVKTGDILGIKGVDVWVNSENTDMAMDRVIGKTISANIRYGGAQKDSRGAVLVDVIGMDLRRKLDGRAFVEIGTVLETESGALATSHGVNRIVHVATVDAVGPGRGVKADLELISQCLARALAHVHARNRRWSLLLGADRSILVPLMGAGDGGLKAAQVAPRLVDTALRFFEGNPRTSLREIFLLAYSSADYEACVSALLARPELEAQ
jgi:ADP-ribose pyrophosphatase